MTDRPVRSAYIIKTLHWGRVPSMYGDDWVDVESIDYKESLSEAITYANDQCKVPKTIESKVYSNFSYELMYTALPESVTNTVDQSA
jgi:hypothetical protein